MAAADESTQGKLERLEKLREEAEHPASEQSVKRQHDAGKMLARERVEKLLDPDPSSSSTGSCAIAIRSSG